MTERLSLTELQLIIRDSIYLSMPDFYWVVAEISEIKQNFSGHCYLELVEKNDDTDLKARVRAVIWGNRYGFIRSFFENATGESLREGFKVLLKVRVEYHEIYGLSLVITDIDPSYTIGEMATKRMQIIKRLEQDGVFNMNKELEIPLVPQRIAIISSKNAAGYTDFLKHLRTNSYNYVFYTALFDAAMQGTETEQSIINALNRIAEKQDIFDVAVIIRGGGSQTDLSWFDNYNIAYYITQFPLPVLTGIGHEKDMSVADMVACRSLKTPTAVADFIIDTIAETEEQISATGSEIKEAATLIIEKYRERLERSKNILAPLTQILISKISKKLTEVTIALLSNGKEQIYGASINIGNLKTGLKSVTAGYINTSRQKLSGMEDRLTMLDPRKVLARGYTITSMNGKRLKSARGVPEGSDIETIFHDGSIRSSVKKSE
jgi:exodeoxyribonuclease VII large subunit